MGSVNRFLRLCLLSCVLPSAASALVEFDISRSGPIVMDTTLAEPIVVTQSDAATPTANYIAVESGVRVSVYLSGVNISNASRSAVSVAPGAELILLPEGTNHLAGGTGHAGIHVPADGESEARLLVAPGRSGDAVLIATGGLGSAGIGGDATQDAGFVRIDGGEVRAMAGSGAGIGGGPRGGRGGTLVVAGGTVFAQGKAGSAGIGGGGRVRGIGGAGGTVEVSGGNVTAFGAPSGAGIGGANNAAGGTVRISGGTVAAKGGAGAAGIGGGAGAGGDGGDVHVSGGWTQAEGDAIAAAASARSMAGAAAVGGGSTGDGGTIVVIGGSLAGEPLGVFGTNAWAAGFVSNGRERVFPVPLAALPDGAAIDLGDYVYAYAGEGGGNPVVFHLPAGESVLCADETGETEYAAISVAEDGTAETELVPPAVSLAWDGDGGAVLSHTGWPGFWVWQATTDLLDEAAWTDIELPPEAAPAAAYRVRAAQNP